MKLRYDGPRRDNVLVLVAGEVVTHPRGQVRDYPDTVGLELLDEG